MPITPVASIDAACDCIRADDLVLDVGGGQAAISRANYVLDIQSWEVCHRHGQWRLKERWPNPCFTKETWIQRDMCSAEPWPFRDKQFDFVFCLGTLEDVRDPIRVCQEMIRVGKAGYMEMPTRILESIPGIERLRYVGHSHHRWLCEFSENEVWFLFKHAQLHVYPRFHVTLCPWIGRRKKAHGWTEAFDFIDSIFHQVNRWFRKPNPKYWRDRLLWRDSFLARERIFVDKDELEAELMEFRRRTNELKDLWMKKGQEL
jgi:SAM-dependent methyltransferase